MDDEIVDVDECDCEVDVQATHTVFLLVRDIRLEINPFNLISEMIEDKVSEGDVIDDLTDKLATLQNMLGYEMGEY